MGLSQQSWGSPGQGVVSVLGLGQGAGLREAGETGLGPSRGDKAGQQLQVRPQGVLRVPAGPEGQER